MVVFFPILRDVSIKRSAMFYSTKKQHMKGANEKSEEHHIHTH